MSCQLEHSLNVCLQVTMFALAALDAVRNFHKEDGTKVRTPSPSPFAAQLLLLYYSQAQS
jgi:hypothetical protein